MSGRRDRPWREGVDYPASPVFGGYGRHSRTKELRATEAQQRYLSSLAREARSHGYDPGPEHALGAYLTRGEASAAIGRLKNIKDAGWPGFPGDEEVA